MFWYTRDELVELYDRQFGRNYYGEDYLQHPVMILKKTEKMLPYEISKAGYCSGGTMDAYFNREEIYFKNHIGEIVLKVNLNTTEGREIVDCVAFIDKNPMQEFYSLLIYPDSLSIQTNKLIDRFEKVEKENLSAEDIGLEGPNVKASLVRATIIEKKKFFYAFSSLKELVEGADSRLVTILPNIEPAEYSFYNV